MHEMSIVLSIVELAREQVVRAGARQVDEIELDIGHLAGIEMDALQFAWRAAVPGTVLEHAQPVIRRIQAKARCVDCGKEFEADSHFAECPACQSLFTQVYAGQELRVRALTVT